MVRSDEEEAEGSLPRCCDGGGAARDAGTPMRGKQCGLTRSRLFFIRYLDLCVLYSGLNSCSYHPRHLQWLLVA